MDEYTVYVHIDPEGKRYYGATKAKNVNQRWKKNGRGYKHNRYFMLAINKYGWSNIQHIIIVKGLTKDEAHLLEEELIRAFDTTNPDKGYNIAKGGKGPNGVTRSEDTRKKMSKSNSKPVICLTTRRVFPSVKDGAEYYGISSSGSISDCCRGRQKSAGKLNGVKLVWKYITIITL